MVNGSLLDNGSWLMVNGSWLMINLIDMAYEKKYNKSNWGKKEPPKSYKEKRGKLSPLMTEEDKHQASIHELSYDFACRITRLYQYLTEDAEPMEQREQSLKLVC